uniref:Uncharacterized protein n=1 Tax=Solanum lycopersicum TaxID=4081 RepID=A0A3Q7I108_SOLLC
MREDSEQRKAPSKQIGRGVPSAQRSKAHFPFKVKRHIKKGWPVKSSVPSRTKFRINKGS